MSYTLLTHDVAMEHRTYAERISVPRAKPFLELLSNPSEMQVIVRSKFV